jgi:hypothetical protein
MSNERKAGAGLATASGSAASILATIQSYLGNGGLFNPEMMDHDKVRDLIMDCRTEIERLQKYEQRMKWLHDCSNGSLDSEGYEWGIYRVKWEYGRAVEVWQTNSDFSDLDAEMAKPQNAEVSNPAPKI